MTKKSILGEHACRERAADQLMQATKADPCLMDIYRDCLPVDMPIHSQVACNFNQGSCFGCNMPMTIITRR